MKSNRDGIIITGRPPFHCSTRSESNTKLRCATGAASLCLGKTPWVRSQFALKPALALIFGAFILIPGVMTVHAAEDDSPDEFESETTLEFGYEKIRSRARSPEREDREFVVDLNLSQFSEFSSSYSGLIDVLASSEQRRTATPRSSTKTEFLELEQIWLQWKSNDRNPAKLRVGRQTSPFSNAWWWDEEVNAVSLITEIDSIRYTMSVAENGEPITTDELPFEPENDSIFWAMGSMEYTPNENLLMSGYLIRKADRSDSYSNGSIIPESDFDESDDRINWFGASLGRAFDHFDFYVDAAYMRAKNDLTLTAEDDLEESDEEEDPETDVLTGAESVEIAETIRQKNKGWALNSWLGWRPSASSHSKISLGYAIGSGTKASKAPSSRTFQQTGLQDTETSHGVLLQPELSNIAIASVRIDLPGETYGNFRIQYNRFMRQSGADDTFDAELDIEISTNSRNIGYEASLVYEYEFASNLVFNASAARFKPRYAFGSDTTDSIKYYEVKFNYEF